MVVLLFLLTGTLLLFATIPSDDIVRANVAVIARVGVIDRSFDCGVGVPLFNLSVSDRDMSASVGDVDARKMGMGI